MSISPIGSNNPIMRLQGSKALEHVPGSQEAVVGELDRVEISDSARYLGEIRRLPEIREGKVQAARDAIASGQFETSARIDGTVDRLLEELKP